LKEINLEVRGFVIFLFLYGRDRWYLTMVFSMVISHGVFPWYLPSFLPKNNKIKASREPIKPIKGEKRKAFGHPEFFYLIVCLLRTWCDHF